MRLCFRLASGHTQRLALGLTPPVSLPPHHRAPKQPGHCTQPKASLSRAIPCLRCASSDQPKASLPPPCLPYSDIPTLSPLLCLIDQTFLPQYALAPACVSMNILHRKRWRASWPLLVQGKRCCSAGGTLEQQQTDTSPSGIPLLLATSGARAAAVHPCLLPPRTPCRLFYGLLGFETQSCLGCRALPSSSPLFHFSSNPLSPVIGKPADAAPTMQPRV
jgi:hypothetical protein